MHAQKKKMLGRTINRRIKFAFETEIHVRANFIQNHVPLANDRAQEENENEKKKQKKTISKITSSE